MSASIDTRSLLDFANTNKVATLPSISLQEALTTNLPEPDQILRDFCDVGDVLAVFGKSKQRKSWFMLQLAISLATGTKFLQWEVPRPFSVLLFQLEVQQNHYLRRMQRVARGMLGEGAVFAKNLENLRVHNCRGRQITTESIKAQVSEIRPDVCLVDPIYTLVDEENATEGMKSIAVAFGEIAEQGMTVIYSHHDKKGKSGDTDPVDRGAGSNILSRAYDASLAIDPHSDSLDHSVIQPITRNYAPTLRFAATWEDFTFIVDEDTDATPETTLSSNMKARRGPSLETRVQKAADILPGGEIWLDEATTLVSESLNVGQRKAAEILRQLRDPEIGLYEEKRFGKGKVRLIPRREDVWS